MMKITLFLTLGMILLAAAACAADEDPATSQTDRPVETAASTGENPGGAEPAKATPKAETPAALPSLGAAPTWDNDVWINSDRPLPLEELRGKVVLLEFWTFG